MRGGAAISNERLMQLYEGTAPGVAALPRELEQVAAGVTADTWVTNPRGYFGPVSGLAAWQEQQYAEIGQSGGRRRRLRSRRRQRRRQQQRRLTRQRN